MNNLRILLAGALLVGTTACQEGGNFFLSPADDVELGREVQAQVLSDPAQFPILDVATHPEAYTILRSILDDVLAAEDVIFDNPNENNTGVTFLYDEVRIIHDDNTLNAFCTPGGFICVYTGLIHYLDTEDQLAGVIGHEVAHAELRHTADALERQMGLDALLQIVLGDRSEGLLAELGSAFFSLSYGRAAETEADEFSVKYLADAPWQCNGAAGFFIKLENDGAGSSGPAWLSTHPSSDNRVAEINDVSTEEGCSTTTFDTSGSRLDALKAALPTCVGDPCDGSIGG